MWLRECVHEEILICNFFHMAAGLGRKRVRDKGSAVQPMTLLIGRIHILDEHFPMAIYPQHLISSEMTQACG